MTSRELHDALVCVFTAAVAAADNFDEARRVLTTCACVSRAWFAAATAAAPYRLLAVREWPALRDFEPPCGWRRFVRALFCARVHGTTPNQRMVSSDKDDTDEHDGWYRFFLDVFDIATCELLASVQLRPPKLGSGREPTGVAPSVPMDTWAGKNVRFRVTVLRTSDGAVAQLLHAAAVSCSRYERGEGGETMQYGPRPRPGSPQSASDGPSDSDSDDSDDEEAGLVAQTDFHTRRGSRNDFETCVHVYAGGGTAYLEAEYGTSGSSGTAYLGAWLTTLVDLVWALPPHPPVEIVYSLRSGDSEPISISAAEVLPHDVLLRILEQLEPCDIAAAALTCMSFAAAARTQRVWRAALLNSTPALAHYIDANMPPAADFSWRSLVAQTWEARYRPSWHEEGRLSDVTLLLQVDCVVAAQHGVRRVLLYSGAFLCLSKKVPSERYDAAEFCGCAKNVLITDDTAHRPFNATGQLPPHPSAEDAIAWFRGDGNMRVFLYAVRASDGAVAELIGGSSDDFDLDHDEQLRMFALEVGGCTLEHTLCGSDSLTCSLNAQVTLQWPVKPPLQLPPGVPLAHMFPRAYVGLQVDGSTNNVCDHFTDLYDKDILLLLAHADWQLVV